MASARRSRVGTLLSCSLAALSSSCMPYLGSAPTKPAGEASTEVEVVLLSARYSAAAVAEEGGLGRIILVFSERLDPASLGPGTFLVNLEDGRWMVPERAVFDPASTWGRNRSISLLAAYPAPPVGVHILEGVFSEQGHPAAGGSGQVLGLDEPDQAIYAEQLPPEARNQFAAGTDGQGAPCTAILRTFWSDVVSEVAEDGVDSVLLSLDGGPPTRVERVVTGGPRDNVVDLCVGGDGVRRIDFPAAFARDHAGLETKAGQVLVRPWVGPAPQPEQLEQPERPEQPEQDSTD